jgi:threonine/homoserine/homoserine lactone efflux protein
MPLHLLVYVGVVALIIVLPGPDTAVVTKNALLHGRPAALGTAVGVNGGLSVWTIATAVGLTGLLRASGTAYDALKLVGAAYLIWLGARALWDSRGGADAGDGVADAAGGRISGRPRRDLGAGDGFRQGALSNLANPKIAIFFTSLLPQFVSTHHSALPQLLILGAIFIAMNMAWMSGYALAAVRLSTALAAPPVKRLIDRVSGCALVGVGVWLATDRR